MKRSTLADIARESQVDVSTVSLVLNNKALAGRLKKETRQRIVDCAQKLNYRPQMAGRILRSGKTNTIGLVVGDISSLFYSQLTGDALLAAATRGKQLLIAATEWSPAKEHQALKNLLSVGVDGIIYLPGSLEKHADLLKIIRTEKIPTVVYNYHPEGTAAVFADHSPGMDELVKHWSAHHRRIGYIGRLTEESNKIDALQAAAGKYGCAVELHDCHVNDHLFCFDFDDTVITRPGAPKAWLVGGSESAVILSNRLQRRGLKIPHDIEIAGIGIAKIGKLQIPALSHLAVDTQQLVDSIFELLKSHSTEIKNIPCLFAAQETTR